VADFFQVGGSLGRTASSYVERQADEDLYQALLEGQYCYLLNARQMGKSSLLIHTVQRLEAQPQDFRCAILDMTHQGSVGVTEAQWYKGIVTELWQAFGLYSVFDLQSWWQAQDGLAPQYRLSLFIKDLLTKHLPEQQIVIFLDEIDAVLGLGFSCDDFFALIRSCYNDRAHNAAFQRLRFVMVGVATPGDLISNPATTPFNIGTAIDLTGFSLAEAAPLLEGLPYAKEIAKPMLEAILHWTNGQPFLTQKLCSLASTAEAVDAQPRELIDSLVRERIIDRWRQQDEPQHLRTIHDRLTAAAERTPYALVQYAQLLQGAVLKASGDQAHMVLALAGVVVSDDNQLRIANRIYPEIFDPTWVADRLAALRPYSQSLEAWLSSGRQDASRLLHGQALRDAQAWSQDKSLDNIDQQFLIASAEAERKQLELQRQAEQAESMSAALTQQRRTSRLQRIVLAMLAVLLIGTVFSGITIYKQYQRAETARQEALELARQAQLDQVKALHSSFVTNFEANQHLTALLQMIEATQLLKRIDDAPPELAENIRNALRQAVFAADQYNELDDHSARSGALAISRDNEMIATASANRTIKIWGKDGSLKTTLAGHEGEVRAVKFSPDGRLIASASGDATVMLWRPSGEPVATLRASKGDLLEVAFAPDGHSLAAAGADENLFVWDTQGHLLQTIHAHTAAIWAVEYSPDGSVIATASSDGSVKLWSTATGTLLHVLKGHDGAVRDVALGTRMIATASDDHTIKLWNYQGHLIRSLTYSSPVETVQFSADGSLLISGAEDSRITVWRTTDATPLKTLSGHHGRILNVAITSDNSTVISSSWDNTVRLWRINGSLHHALPGHRTTIRQIAFSPDGHYLVSGGLDSSVRLWSLEDKSASRMIGHHNGPVKSIAISPDQTLIASAGEDGLAKLWTFDGRLVAELKGHLGGVKSVAFSDSGDTIVTGGADRSIKIWSRNGKLIASLDGHTGGIWGVNTGPDGLIASASLDNSAIIRNRNGEKVATLNGHKDVVTRVAFSPDGLQLATASFDGAIGLWRSDGSLIKWLKGQVGNVLSVNYSPDGRFIASASSDETVKLWAADGTLITTLAHDAPVWTAVFSPDGHTLASAGVDGQIQLWDLEKILKLDELAYACGWVADLLRTNHSLAEQRHAICD